MNFNRVSSPLITTMPNVIHGYVLVDNDGTFIPGTEVRNRKILQILTETLITDGFEPNVVTSSQIPWDNCGGKAEQDIFDILIKEGIIQIPKHETTNTKELPCFTADNFKQAAEMGYNGIKPDFSARSGMITALLRFKEQGIVPILVTNSPRDIIDDSLNECFSQEDVRISDVFPHTVTKTEVLEAGRQPKPSPDPFHFALEQANEMFETDIRINHTMVLEDSPTGAEAGFAFTGNKLQVVQFTDIAPQNQSAGHHVTTMDQCSEAMCLHFKIPQHKIIDHIPHPLESMTQRP